MFNFFKKSPDKILTNALKEVGNNLIRQNSLQLPEATWVHNRFANGAFIFSNLLCQDIVKAHDKDTARALSICTRLTQEHLDSAAELGAQRTRIQDLVVWDEEREDIRERPLNSKIAGDDWDTIVLPLPEILAQLYFVRQPRMTKDMLRGATFAAQKGPGSVALLMPISSTFIMQVTADQEKANDEKTVTGFAVSLITQFMWLDASVKDALK